MIGGEELSSNYLYVADIAGYGPALLGKMFAAQNMVGDVQWVFGGNYLPAKENNLLTINMLNNWISQWNAVALWGPQEVSLEDFLLGRSDTWYENGGQDVVKELLGGRIINDIGAIREMMRHQEGISWLLAHLKVIYNAPKVVFARNGVYLNQDFLNTPIDFAVNALGQYWWNPGSHHFAYNQTEKIVVTSLDQTSQIYGKYFDSDGRVIRGPADNRSFGIQYPNEPPRLILHRGTKFDQNSQQELPIIYIINSEKGLVGAL